MRLFLPGPLVQVTLPSRCNLETVAAVDRATPVVRTCVGALTGAGDCTVRPAGRINATWRQERSALDQTVPLSILACPPTESGLQEQFATTPISCQHRLGVLHAVSSEFRVYRQQTDLECE